VPFKTITAACSETTSPGVVYSMLDFIALLSGSFSADADTLGFADAGGRHRSAPVA